jgi:ImcF (intracellular multiplication and macrophage-killing)-related protein
MNFLNAIISPIQSAISLVFPLFRNAVSFSKWNKWIWYTLHFIIIALIVCGLWYLNNHVPQVKDPLFNWLRTNAPTWVHPIFLPAVFLLVYLLSWVLYWIWLQLGPDAEVDEFPDITSAWADGIARLASKGIKSADLPLFLILGSNRAGAEFLFKSGQVPIDVFGPVTGDPPVRVWASRDAIYVTAPGASALGTYADLLQRSPFELSMGGGGDAAKKTVGLGDDDSLDATVQEINALRALARTRELSPEEKVRMRELATTAQSKPQRVKPALSADVARLSADRLRYLCKLISRDRRPFCPINGLLLLVPWEMTENDESVKSAALALRHDMLTSRAGLQLCARTIVLVCDLEEVRGFEQFRAGFNAEQIAARIGQRFPLVPDQPEAEQNVVYDTGAIWLGEKLLPGRVYQALQLDATDPRTLIARNLFQLYRQAYERMPRLGRMLRMGMPQSGYGPDGLDGPPLFAGCYLAGTGREPNQQAFAAGVFERLADLQEQGIVAWTPSALSEDKSYKRSANVGYATIAILAGLLAVASVWMWKIKA